MRRFFEVFPDKNLSDFNCSGDRLIESFQLFCGHPKLIMVFRPYILSRVFVDRFFLHFKFCYKAQIVSGFIAGVPFFGNFGSIVFIQDRIKDRLPGNAL